MTPLNLTAATLRKGASLTARIFALTLIGSATVLAASGLTENSVSPNAKVHRIALNEARWTSGFWADRFENCRTNMLPSMVRLMAGTNYSQFLRNFEVAAGLAEGRYRGASFNDGEVYKMLQGLIVAYAMSPSEAQRQQIDEIIALIAKAQRDDGYLHTSTLIKLRQGDSNAAPFQNRNNFEMYNMGHLMTTACVHHQVTGQTNLLTVARNAADYLYDTFFGASPEAARSSVCPSHYMGIVDLYRETGDPRYLALAKKFFELRSQITDGGDDNQDRIPFEQQREAMGHAVRANYLYAGAADLFMETGDQSLWQPLEPIWRNLTERKMYITGGCGALYDGASPYGSKNQGSITRTHQAYGHNYELPNTTAHNETCANIGNVLWNWRMFLITGEARYMDVAELALYNSVLSGVSLDGTNFFYTNPLRVTDPLPIELRWSRERKPYVSSFCCPPNLVRTIAGSAQFAYGKSTNTIWVNLYGDSTLDTTVADGSRLKLTQQTRYPWDGKVRLVINECRDKPFALKLRIPGWADSATVRVNGKAETKTATPGTYCELRRQWKAGDIVGLDIPMPPKLIEANPLVEETLNQVAVKRGPMVYCLESPDLPNGVGVMDVCVPTDVRLNSHFEPDLLGGVTVLTGTFLTQPMGDWNGKLYRDIKRADAQPVKAKLIPYYVWGNRGRGEMSVWLRRP